jgi:hypothetical protein
VASLLNVQIAHNIFFQLGEDALVQAVAVDGQAQQAVQHAETTNGFAPGCCVPGKLLKHWEKIPLISVEKSIVINSHYPFLLNYRYLEYGLYMYL